MKWINKSIDGTNELPDRSSIRHSEHRIIVRAPAPPLFRPPTSEHNLFIRERVFSIDW